MSRHNRPCLLCKVTTQVKVKPAIFGLGAQAPQASPEVSGLEKPPAGSGREGGGGGNGPSWKETVDMGEGQPLSQGTLCNHRAALLLGSSSSNQEGLAREAFSTHSRRHCPPDRACFTSIYSHRIFRSSTTFKAYTVVRRNEVGGAGKHTTKASSQQQNLSSKFPSKGSGLHDQAPIPPALPFLGSRDPTAGVRFTFSANDLQMYRSSGCLTTPTLKERKKGKENDKS